jgi:hypothetical protein
LCWDLSLRIFFSILPCHFLILLIFHEGTVFICSCFWILCVVNLRRFLFYIYSIKHDVAKLDHSIYTLFCSNKFQETPVAEKWNAGKIILLCMHKFQNTKHYRSSSNTRKCVLHIYRAIKQNFESHNLVPWNSELV